eukprot:95126-Prorocentrum_minimum.AAC.2
MAADNTPFKLLQLAVAASNKVALRGGDVKGGGGKQPEVLAARHLVAAMEEDGRDADADQLLECSVLEMWLLVRYTYESFMIMYTITCMITCTGLGRGPAARVQRARDVAAGAYSCARIHASHDCVVGSVLTCPG